MSFSGNHLRKNYVPFGDVTEARLPPFEID